MLKSSGAKISRKPPKNERRLEDQEIKENVRSINTQDLFYIPSSESGWSRINNKCAPRPPLVSLKNEEAVIPANKQSPNNKHQCGSFDIRKSDLEDVSDHELFQSPDDFQGINSELMNDKNNPYSETKSSTKSHSNPQGNLQYFAEGKSFENRLQGTCEDVENNNMCTPITKSKSFSRASKVYKSALLSASKDVSLSSYPKKTIPYLHNVKTKSLRRSHSDVKIRKRPAAKRAQLFQFCSPCSPEVKQDTKICVLM